MTQSNTSERIADAALSILENEGAGAVSMRRVADAVGLSAMAIYRHFPNREALLKSISDRGFLQLLDYWSEYTRDGDVEARLLGTQQAYLEYALAHPHVFDYVFAETRKGMRRFPEGFRAPGSPTFNLMIELLREGMGEGLFRKDDVLEAAMTVWAHSHGLVTLYRAGRFSYEPDEFRVFYRRSLQRVLDGLKR